MSNELSICLPKLGESIVSATVIKWFKKEGDFVSIDEPLLEVSTDKVNSEIPSPYKGVLKRILVQEDHEVEVGATLAVLESFVQNSSSTIQPPKILENENFETSDFLSPAVLRLIKEFNVTLDELKKIPASGSEGRLTRNDLKKFCEGKLGPKVHLSEITCGFEKIKMTHTRKAIAENMVKSFYQAPHASLATTVDVTEIVKYIQIHKEKFFQTHKAKLSITAFVALSIANSVKEYPLINSSLDADTIVLKKFINLGIAVNVDQNVIVPVIAGCNELSISEIAVAIANLASRAKEHCLTAQEVSSGTLTLTNFGITGIELGIPIIRYPEVAIIALGAITKKVVAMPDDSIAIRSVCQISLTFDHRVLDGIYGCGFLNALKMNLENFALKENFSSVKS